MILCILFNKKAKIAKKFMQASKRNNMHVQEIRIGLEAIYDATMTKHLLWQL